MPMPVLEEIQRDLLALPGVGMSILEISHRSKTFESIIARGRGRHPHARRHPRELPRAVSAGRRQPAVLDGADEPADARRRPPTTSTPAPGRRRRSRKRRKVGDVHVAASTKAENYVRMPRQAELQLTPAPPTSTSRRTTRSKAPSTGRCRRSATRRSSATPRPTCSAGRSTSRGTR